jgi:HSP20 family molecular chaperone IbpA
MMRPRRPQPGGAAGLSGLLDGLRQLAEGLQGLSGQGESGQGERSLDIGGREGRVVFGYSIRTADGKAEAFGHVPSPQAPAARQPIVDIIEEADAILVIAEMPGVALAELSARIEDGALVLESSGKTRWNKRIELPGAVTATGVTLGARNGIVEVRMPRAGGPE